MYCARIQELTRVMESGAALSSSGRAQCLQGLKQVLTERKLFWEQTLTGEAATHKAYIEEDIQLTFDLVEFFTSALRRLRQVEAENADLRGRLSA